ncbi:MAG: ABC transporter substrate-binding protein [Cellvibrionaceae bacterium]
MSIITSVAVEADTAEKPLKIAFFSPGYEQSQNPTGQFWPESSRFAQAVADQLQIKLDIYHANRDYLRMQRQIAEVLRGENPPDYLLLVNERFALSPQIRDINQAGVNFFLAYNHLQKPESDALLIPRRDYKHWVGSLVPDNRYAGYSLAKHLIDELQPMPPNVLVLAGDNLTSAAKLREQGLADALAETPNASIHERLIGNWGYAEPRAKIHGILRRHPNINMIWSANGPMALGALQGLNSSQLGWRPKAIGSINWDTEELAAVESGELAVSYGGHFMTAGISLILLTDHHNGIDFKEDGGTYQQRQLFYRATTSTLKRYPILKTRQWHQLAFLPLSKHHNPELRQYHFGLESLFRSSQNPLLNR